MGAPVVSVARRLWLALGLNAALLLVVVVQHVRTIERTVGMAQELSEVSAQLVLLQAEQSARITLLEETAAKLAVTGDARYRTKLEELRAAVDVSLDGARALPLAPAEVVALDALEQSWRTVRDTLPLEFDALREANDALARTAQQTMRDRLVESAQERNAAVRVSWLAAALAAMLVLVTVWLLRRSITRPLASLAAGTRVVAAGDFTHRVDAPARGEFAEVAASFNDMTRRLGALDRLKRDFVTTVSHDLKSPLASLRETTSLLLDEVPGPLADAQRRVLLLQRESADRLGEMIAKLLDLSRLEAELPLVFEPVALQPFLARAVAHADAAGRARAVRVELASLTPTGLTVHADEDRLRQLVDNLLENAVKFSPADGTVTVSVRAVPPSPENDVWMRLEVADRGPGVEPYDRARIFERFAQTAAGRAIAQRGAGIGLTICREVVQAHRGRIGVEPRDGGGSVFVVELPRASVRPDAEERETGRGAELALVRA